MRALVPASMPAWYTATPGTPLAFKYSLRESASKRRHTYTMLSGGTDFFAMVVVDRAARPRLAPTVVSTVVLL